MGKVYFASLRLAFALVCIGASLILGAHWFGFLPDAAAMKMQARQSLSEAIALNTAAHVRKQQWVDLRACLQTQVDRDPELLSIGIRSELGVLRAQTSHHEQLWPNTQTSRTQTSRTQTSRTPASTTRASRTQNSRMPVSHTGASHTGASRTQASRTRNFSSASSHRFAMPARQASPVQGRDDIATIEVPITLNRRPWGQVELCFHEPSMGIFARLMHHPLVRLLTFFIVCGLFAYLIFVIRILGVFNSTQVVPDRVRRALDTLAEGLLVLDEAGRIVLANQAFADIVGSDVESLANQSARELQWVASEDDSPSYPWEVAITRAELQSERMLRYQLPNGSQRIFSVNAAPLGTDRSQRGALATFRDVTHVEEHRVELERMLSLLRSSRDEIKRKNSELEILATQDALTGCLNRRAFFERFEIHWNEATTEDSPLACVMIDVDHFKSVNDTYGHHVGDEVLRKVSSVIRSLFKDNGVVCRYGGEEFCILLPGLDLKQAIDQAEIARMAVGEIEFDEPAELHITSSLGVSELRFDAEDPQELINQADACLYVAKREGRNRVIAYNVRMADAQQAPESTGPRRRIDIPYQAVTALVTALSYRDANTAEHSRRVADLCARVADGLLDPGETYVLEIAALLHDIGKIGVPDHILLKPGPLTSDEWEVMGRHDRIGVEIIASAFDCPPLSAIISTHHAFYGGCGRDPQLPRGEDIPIGGRLLAIADSYDAMVSDRAYRKGCTHAEAIAELRRCAGSQFDPRLVEHFAERISSPTPELAAGALSIQKMTAIDIGHQVERLANAVATKDLNGIKSLANRLGRIASHTHIQTLCVAAQKIEAASVDDEQQWIAVLRATHELLDICRSTQSHFLRETLECGATQANHPTALPASPTHEEQAQLTKCEQHAPPIGSMNNGAG